HQVAGERRLDRHRGGLAVADLADHDDVGIVAQIAAQDAGERQVDLWIDGYLGNTLQLIFDRVFYSEDVEIGRVDLGETRVQRGGLAGARRAGHENDSVRAANQVIDDIQMIFAEADIGQIVEHARTIEQTNGDALAVDAGRGGDAHVDVLAGDLAADTPVLRQPLLGDVQAGHDLDARQD